MNLNEFIAKSSIEILPETCRFEKIDDATYFSKQYSDYVSNSRLNLIDPRKEGSPEKYFEGFSNSVNATCFMQGSAVHVMTLQKELFELNNELFLPNGQIGFIADECYNLVKNGGELTEEQFKEKLIKYNYYKGLVPPVIYDKAWQEVNNYIKQRKLIPDFTTDGKERMFLTKKIYDVASSCITSLENNKDIQALLHPTDLLTDKPLPTYNEQAVLLNIVITFPNGQQQELKLKSKLDNFTYDELCEKVVINDVKTTSGLCSDFSQNYLKWGYYREFGMYNIMLSQVMKTKFNLPKYNIEANALVVETTTNTHESCVYPIPLNTIQRGIKEFAYLVKLVAYYTKYGY